LNTSNGRTDEGAKCPVTRRSRLLVVWWARCALCGVSSHRPAIDWFTGAACVWPCENVIFSVANRLPVS